MMDSASVISTFPTWLLAQHTVYSLIFIFISPHLVLLSTSKHRQTAVTQQTGISRSVYAFITL